jgi:type IV pilus assembly protein PilM
MPSLSDDLQGSLQKFKNIFKKKKMRSVGIDIGAEHIRIVELEKKKKEIWLKNYALVKFKSDRYRPTGSGAMNNLAGTLIDKAMKKAGIECEQVNTAVPSFSSFVTIIEVPNVGPAEMDSVIAVEAPKFIPVPLADVVYGWQFIDSNTAQTPGVEKTADNFKKADQEMLNNPTVKVLLVAVMKDLSNQIETVLKKYGISIEYLEVDSFSMKRVLEGNKQESILMVDFGDRVSTLLIASGGVVAFNRSLDIGGRKLTETIARGVGIGSDKAEQLKVKYGMKIDEKFRVKLLETAVGQLCTELRNAVQLFQKDQYAFKGVSKIILSGGGALLPGLREFVEKSVGLPTEVANPWANIKYKEELKNILKQKAPVFTCAVGLAMLGLEEEEDI